MNRARRVAVIGGGVGGLVAAGELARAGCEVTLFEAGPQVGGKAGQVCAGGLTLDTGPTLLTMPTVVRETFERLGALDLLPELTPLQVQCEYRWRDGGRFTVTPSLEQTCASAERLAAGEGSAAADFYAEAARIHRRVGAPYLAPGSDGWLGFAARFARGGPAGLLTGMRLGTLDALARRHFRSDKLVQFAGRYATYAGASPYQASAAFAMIAHLERAEGVFHPKGGMGALSRALGQAVRRLGAELLLGASARFERRGSELWVHTGERERRFDAVVMNADPLAHLGRTEEPLALSGYVLLVEADRRLALPHHTILFADDARAEHAALAQGRVPADPTLYLCHPAASDPSMAPEGKERALPDGERAAAAARPRRVGRGGRSPRGVVPRARAPGVRRRAGGRHAPHHRPAHPPPPRRARSAARLDLRLPPPRAAGALSPAAGARAHPGPLLRRRRHPPGRRRAPGDALRPARGGGGARVNAANDAYRWLYLDVTGEGFTAVVIFMYGAPFSSRYSARAGAGAAPGQHAAVNFALYRDGVREAWVLSEFSRAHWAEGGRQVRIGGSSLEQGADGKVRVELNERTALWGRPLRATVELEPLGPGHAELPLVPGQPHFWQPRAPFARAEVRVSQPDASFSGRAYFDANRGAELLGGGVPGWRWARLHRPQSTEVLYEPPGGHLRVRAEARGASVVRGAPQQASLRRTWWGLDVPRAFDALEPALTSPRLLESSPFYARLESSSPGADLLGEVADFRRFHRPTVRWMARFRTRVES